MNYCFLPLVIFVIIIIGTGVTFAFKSEDPCRNKEFAYRIAKLSAEEKSAWEKILKQKTPSDEHQACQSALLGRLYESQGRFSEASSAFLTAAEKSPLLGDYFILAKANAEFKAKNYHHAKSIAKTLKASKHSSYVRNKAEQLLAEIAVIEKNDQEIIETHRELVRDKLENERHLFALASSLSTLGEKEEANEIFKQLLIRFPSSKEAKKVEVQNTKASIKLSPEESENRFNKLIAKLDFDQVVTDADQAIKKLGKNAKERAAYNGFAVKSLILNNKFQQGLLRAEKQALSKDSTAKDFENYAWSLGKVGRLVEAANYYSRFAQKSLDTLDKAKGCFFSGFSLYEANLYSVALFTWQKCADLMNETPLRENYLWYQALSSMLLNNFDMAQLLLQDLMSNFKGKEQEKYAFFLGYSLHQRGNKNAGDAVLRKIANNTSPSYYVMSARRFLGLTTLKGQKIPANALADLSLSCKEAACHQALTLYHLGFAEEAKDLILRAKINNEEKLAVLQQMERFHDVWQRSYLINPQSAINNAKLVTNHKIRASYPLPHQEIISSMSRKYSISSTLLYAIIRTESGFSPEAESYRGALGLMQMMPFTANDLAKKLALNQFSPVQLKEPAIAIEFGSLFLATLKRQFAKTHIVIAAYNAGPQKVQQWLNDFGDLRDELFVERIPFEQTREYVKKVLTTANLYSALDGKAMSLLY